MFIRLASTQRAIKLLTLIAAVLWAASKVWAQEVNKPTLVIQSGHSDSVASVTYSPDGRTIASASFDNTIRLWDATGGKQLWSATSGKLTIYGRHSGDVVSVIFSPNGKTVAWLSGGNSIKLLDATNGRLIWSLEHSDVVSSIAFSPDGKAIASGSWDGTIWLWDTASGKPTQSLKARSGWTTKVGRFARETALPNVQGLKDPLFQVTSVSYSPDGRTIASVGWEVPWKGGDSMTARKSTWIVEPYYRMTIKLWDAASGKLIRSFGGKRLRSQEGHAFSILSVAYSPDGKMIASGNVDKSIKLWDASSGKLIRSLEGHSDRVLSITYSPDGRTISSGSMDKSVKFWDASSSKLIRSLEGHSKGVNSVAYSPDGKTIVSGSADKSIRLWSVTNNEPIWSRGGHADWIYSVAYSLDGKTIASGGGDNTIKLWDATSGRLVRSFEGYLVTYSPDGKTIASVSADGTIKLWDLTSGNLIKNLEGNFKGTNSVAYSPDGKTIVSGSADSLINLWDATSGKLIRSLEDRPDVQPRYVAPFNMLPGWATTAHSKGVSSVAYSPDGKTIVSGGGYEEVTSRVNLDGTYEPNLKIPTRAIKLWDASSGRLIRSLKKMLFYVTSVAYSPDGKTIASGGLGGIELWDASSGELIRSLGGHSGWVNSVVFSPDGKMIASGGVDSTVKLWDTGSGELIQSLEGHSNSVTSVAYSPDGKALVTGSQDYTTKTWSFDTGDLLVNLIAFNDGNWIAYTPAGYYHSSEDASKYVTWRVGDKIYDFDQFFERFFKPEIIAQVLQGKKVETSDSIAQGFALPPEVTITSPLPGQTFPNPEIEITVEAKDSGGGVDEIRLYQNGKVVNTDQRGVGVKPSNKNVLTAKHRITLQEGDNLFRATAFSRDRTESRPYELTVRLTAPGKEVALRLLIVGINQYKNPALNLNYAVPDAKGIAAYFKEKGQRLFREVELIQLYDTEATRMNILKAFEKLREKTQPEDVAILYFAGHGDSQGSEWHFIPHELTRPEEEKEIAANSISSTLLAKEVRQVRSQKMLLLLDACRSGSVLMAFRGYEDRKALMQLSRSTGIHIIAASSRDQVASEVSELGHGIFTYLLLKGLNGEAVMKNTENTVTVLGLLTYLNDQLPEISKKYKKETQYPVSSSNGMDFPLAVVR